MPVVIHQFGAFGALGQPGYNLAKTLALACVAQYQFQTGFGTGTGIGPGSCWAAVAATANATAGYPAVQNGMAFVFGNSRMANIGANVNLPGLPNPSNHAERNALIAAGNATLVLHQLPGGGNHNVMFVQLSPCAACANWLGGGATTGVANPYNFGPTGATLHIWHRWAHPGGVGNMGTWNNQTTNAKALDILSNW